MIHRSTIQDSFEFATASRTRPGEGVSGDSYVVQPYPGGILVAVIDGLGHGAEAAASAASAGDVLTRHVEAPVDALIARCHERLRGTRGATISVASIRDSGAVSWVGVGNVAGAVIGPSSSQSGRSRHLPTQAGVVGVRVRAVTVTLTRLQGGQSLVLVTDGVRGGFADDLPAAAAPAALADSILERFARDTDDALVLVVRCVLP